MKEQPFRSHRKPAVSADMDLGGNGRDGGDGRELASSGVGCEDDEGEIALGESG